MKKGDNSSWKVCLSVMIVTYQCYRHVIETPTPLESSLEKYGSMRVTFCYHIFKERFANNWHTCSIIEVLIFYLYLKKILHSIIKFGT